ncbi:hypothetical protein F7731_03540 [Cytobacillus depressus]|uniref:DUF2642 domain-containing protein n=1 Tax=Cytobacillus depressus TaxID=1602942 RepID=A0A6L3VAE3_9BACI|nr:hypothetical protein [Cytobacillus depressus]KAB2338638.1 hypothetical protein F7731_03540 [Cytobacillus depressus]
MEFNHHLTALIGNEVNILLSDGNSVEGVLTTIKDDYFVMETDKYIIYHNLKNVKGFLKSTKNSKNTKKTRTRSVTDYSTEASSLRGVLESLQSKWVTIDIQNSNQNNNDNDNNNNNNNNNNQGYSGFLAAIEDDYVILIGKDVQAHLNISHINNIVKVNEYTMSKNNSNSENSSNNNSNVMAFESVFGGSRR